MPFAKQLERLARLFPGIAGYQDRESARETDKAVRLRLAAEIERLKRSLEEEKEKQLDKKALSLLPLLDQVASKFDKLGNLLRYAARGYSPLFADAPVDQKLFARLYAFDLGLFDELEIIRNEVNRIGPLSSEAELFKEGIKNVNRLIDRFEKTFSARQEIFKTR
jgi:transposase